MLPGADLGIHPCNPALLVDQVADPARAFGVGIVAGAVRHTRDALGVAQQRKRKIEFFGERRVVLDAIEARAEDDDIVGDEVLILIAEPATLGGSAGGIGPGIKPQQDFLAAQAGKRERFALMRRQRKVRCQLSDLEHKSPFRAQTSTVAAESFESFVSSRCAGGYRPRNGVAAS